MRSVFSIAGAGLIACFGASFAHAEPVIAFGDSWADGGAASLAAALAAAGYPTFTVAEHGLPGSTAQQWAVTSPQELSTIVGSYPDARWVWLSVGGNDLFNMHSVGQGAQVAASNDQNIRMILDTLLANHPDILVVMFGYDYTNFVQSQQCMTQAEQFFGVGVTQQQINQFNVTQVGNVMATIAASYPNATYVPIWGALQIAGNVPGAPVIAQPSPAQYMFDCFHPTQPGYRIVANALVQGYWGVPQPTVSIQASATGGCVGDAPITFTSMSTNESWRRWRIDGQAAGNGSTLVFPRNQAGSFQVELSVYNRAWEANASQTIVVSPCIDAGFPDTGPPDTGVPPDAGFPDTGPPDTGVPPDAGFPDQGFVDTGVPPDAGRIDTGFLPDLGIEGPDAGFDDSGISDAAPNVDAEVEDTGMRPDPMLNAEQHWRLGGGCTAVERVSSGGEGAFASLVLLSLLGARRRRRR